MDVNVAAVADARNFECVYCSEERVYCSEERVYFSEERVSRNDFFCHECVSSPPEPLPQTPLKRIQNRMYLHSGTPVYWRGKILFCIHNVRRTTCKHAMCCVLKTHCEHELSLSSPCAKCKRS